MINLFFILEKIGPYHNSRFNYLANNKELIINVIETSPLSKTYLWEQKFQSKYNIFKLNKKSRDSFQNNELALVLYARALFTINNSKQSLFTYQKLINTISYPENFKYKVEYFHKLIDSSQAEKARIFLDEMNKEDNKENGKHKEDLLYLEGTLNIELKEYANAIITTIIIDGISIKIKYLPTSLLAEKQAPNNIVR